MGRGWTGRPWGRLQGEIAMAFELKKLLTDVFCTAEGRGGAGGL